MIIETDRLGVPGDRVGNPHQVPAELDRVMGARHDVTGYSETAFASCWDDTSQVGLFLHIGRCPQDIELWWGQVLVYLPGGIVLADRSWGRSVDPAVMDSGNLRFRFDRPQRGWTVSFDGAAEATTAAALAGRLAGSGPARPLRFEVEFEAAGPMWDLYAGQRVATATVQHSERQDWAQGTHTQQLFRHRGELTYDGVRYPLNGVGGNDHSSGPRSFRRWGGHFMILAALPDRALHGALMYSTAGTHDVLLDVGTLFGPEDACEVVSVRMPFLDDAVGAPSEFEMDIVDGTGDVLKARVEVLVTASVTYTEDNDNLNGLEWDAPDAVVLNESRVRIHLPGGEVGLGYLERGVRLDELRRRRIRS